MVKKYLVSYDELTEGFLNNNPGVILEGIEDMFQMEIL